MDEDDDVCAKVAEMTSLPSMMTSAAPRALSHDFSPHQRIAAALSHPGAEDCADAHNDDTGEHDEQQTRQQQKDVVIDKGALMLGTVDVRAPALLGLQCVISGNLVPYRLHAYVVIEAGVVMRPELRTVLNRSVAIPAHVESVIVQSFTCIGYQTVCEATSVARFVRVEPCCVIHTGTALPEGVWLRRGAVVLSDMVLEPYTMYMGCPAAPCARLARDAHRLMQMEYVRRKIGI